MAGAQAGAESGSPRSAQQAVDLLVGDRALVRAAAPAVRRSRRFQPLRVRVCRCRSQGSARYSSRAPPARSRRTGRTARRTRPRCRAHPSGRRQEGGRSSSSCRSSAAGYTAFAREDLVRIHDAAGVQQALDADASARFRAGSVTRASRRRLLRPMPCSALMAPPQAARRVVHRLVDLPVAIGSLRGVASALDQSVPSTWMLPSPIWPCITTRASGQTLMIRLSRHWRGKPAPVRAGQRYHVKLHASALPAFETLWRMRQCPSLGPCWQRRSRRQAGRAPAPASTLKRRLQSTSGSVSVSSISRYQGPVSANGMLTSGTFSVITSILRAT